MQTHQDIILSRIKSLFDYRDGHLYWRSRPDSDFPRSRVAASWRNRFTGALVGSITDRGYRATSISIYGRNRAYKLHQLIWAWHHLSWPVHQIDHINGIKDDNRIENLRDIPQSDNNRNASRRKDNTSGVTGVHFDKVRGKWVAQMRVEDTYVYLGGHETMGSAIAARKAAEVEHGFLENHGA